MTKKLILTYDTTLNDAIALLDSNGNGVLPVVDVDNVLLGLITDGDIRKAILNKNLDLKNIINTNPYKLNINSSKTKIKNYLKKIHRRHIPLVDYDNRFIKIFTLDELEFNLKPNWVVIMAGGLGTRLGELTKNTPKPMLNVNNKPILHHIIDTFISYGFTKFLISVNYKSEIIKNYFKDGKEYGIEIVYLEEKKRLGTGGALSLVDFKIKDPFFVINGDILSTVNYNEILKFHHNIDSLATMCIRKENYKIPYGVIEIDNQNNIISMIEKPTKKYYINTGIYLLNPEVLKYIPKNIFFDLPTLFTNLKDDKQKITSYEITDYWIDIGKPSDYKQISEDLEF